MQFNEAMEALQKGIGVTRKQWVGSIYFKIDHSGNVLSFQPKVIPYTYSENIMISDGWVVEGLEGEHRFYDIISYLLQGKKAHLTDWPTTSYIQYDRTQKYLFYSSMDVFPYSPDFESFTATDWIVLP